MMAPRSLLHSPRALCSVSPLVGATLSPLQASDKSSPRLHATLCVRSDHLDRELFCERFHEDLRGVVYCAALRKLVTCGNYKLKVFNTVLWKVRQRGTPFNSPVLPC